jgi:hypothetical protein
MDSGLDMRFLGGKRERKNKGEAKALESVVSLWGFALAFATPVKDKDEIQGSFTPFRMTTSKFR